MKRKNQNEHKKVVNGVASADSALPVQNRIALRAYELYLQRGGLDGHADEDWSQAEREMLPHQDR